VDGLPFVKPPYGVVTAINLDTGDIVWQVPLGDTPDEIKNNPALKGLNIGNTGQQATVGEVITKSLVVVGDGLDSTQPGHPRGAYLRAYDQKTGQQVGAVWMPAPQSGSPMTYSCGWQAVHYRRGERRQLLGRLYRLQPAVGAVK
jgi:quinoprotein glucose dehydrogenase